MHPVIDLTDERHPSGHPSWPTPYPPNPALIYPNHGSEHHIIPITSEIRHHQSRILNSFQATNMVNSLIWSHYNRITPQDDSYPRYITFDEHLAELSQHPLQRPTSHVIEPSTPRIQFYTPYQRTFRPPNRSVQNGGHSDQTGPTVHVRPKEKKQESKTKVIDTNGGFDCRICLESLLDIRNKSIDIMASPCGHVFCSTCISSSLQFRATCPICQKPVQPTQLTKLFL